MTAAQTTTNDAKRNHDIAQIAKAMGHHARVEILRFLARRNSCFCGDIVDELPLAQSTVSQHLAELKRAGFIRGTVEGKRVCYCIDRKGILRVQAIVLEFLEPIVASCEMPGIDDDCC